MTQEPDEILNNAENAAILEEDAATLQKALAEESAKAASYLGSWQRAQADYANLKRRTEEERAEFTRVAKANMAYALLPVLDDLERALESIPPDIAGNSWVDGIKLITRHFKAKLEAQGVTEIKALGEIFDPRIHEASRQGRGKEGIITEVLQKGYTVGDRLVRPSQVIVGSGEEKENNTNDTSAGQ